LGFNQPTESEGIRIASLDDIAGMKVNAVLRSGTRFRDFVDLHFLLEEMSMARILEAYHAKYGEVDKEMAIRAILHHEEIEFNIPVALTGQQIGWKEMAERLREAVREPKRIFWPKVAFPKKSAMDNTPNMGKRKGKGPRI
jgi:hypothetical protein